MGQSSGQSPCGKVRCSLPLPSVHTPHKARLPSGAFGLLSTGERCQTLLCHMTEHSRPILPPPHSPTSFQHLAQPGPPSREGDYHSPDGFPQRPVTGGCSRGGASFKHRHWPQQSHHPPVTETFMGPMLCWCLRTFFSFFFFFSHWSCCSVSSSMVDEVASRGQLSN